MKCLVHVAILSKSSVGWFEHNIQCWVETKCVLNVQLSTILQVLKCIIFKYKLDNKLTPSSHTTATW